MSKKRHVLSFESLANGKLNKEMEYTFYVKLKDLSQLDKAQVIEEHEQWRIPIDTESSFRMRIRKINGRIFTMATKLKRKGIAGFEEVEAMISQDQYDHFLNVAEDGYKKTRYCFQIPGTELKWEVDVFLDRVGGKHPWAKVDLEVNDPHMKMPEFPLDYEEFILDNGPDQTMEEMRFVRTLWDEEWSRLDGIETPKLGEDKNA